MTGAAGSAPVSLAELVARFGGTLIGDSERRISGLASLEQANGEQLSFVANPKYLAHISTTRAAAVLISETELANAKRIKKEARSEQNHCDELAFIVTPNPYAYFARVAQLFAAAAESSLSPGIDRSAVVDRTAQVAASASIGPYTVIEAGAQIGERVQLGAHVFVGRGTRIGDDCRIYPNATLYAGCMLGARIIVHAGTVIGSDGFGFAADFSDEQGEWVKIPQVGGVWIGDDVEIGANCTIDRGTMTDTIIEHGVKIDNLVQIAHNCRIGAYTVIAGCAAVAGSAIIGRHCMIGGAAGIAGHLTLTDRVTITAFSGVSKSLTQAGVYTSAFPAIKHTAWNRNAVLMRNLDKMRTRVKQLEAAVAALEICSSSVTSGGQAGENRSWRNSTKTSIKGR